MLDVAVCGHIELDDPAITLDGIVEACAREAGFAETSVEEFDSPLDLIDAVAHPRSTAEIDFVIIGTDIKGVSTSELVHELCAVGHGSHSPPAAPEHVRQAGANLDVEITQDFKTRSEKRTSNSLLVFKKV